LLFGLRFHEAQILLRLMAHSVCTHDQLHAIAPRSAGGTSTLSVTLHTMRKKLKVHGIGITNIKKIGFTIDTKTRDKIYKLLAEQDAPDAA